MKNLLTAILLILITAGCSNMQTREIPVNIIPKPAEFSYRDGTFSPERNMILVLQGMNPEMERTAALFAERFGYATGIIMKRKDYSGKPPKNSVLFTLDTNHAERFGKEGYHLTIKRHRIEITAAKPAGIFYGVQTLWQLMPPEVYSDKAGAAGSEWEIPCCEIEDKPSYSWRGMHLDVSRHFFPKEFIKKYIDLIAMHKMNIFHWHLTDDNGWRLEIKKYPELTSIAAWRVDREEQPWEDRELQQPGEKATYGGFYTQEDVKEIVKYAQDRFVTIIPEIEMPGHSYEVFAAYPQYSCTGKKLTVLPGSYWPNVDIFCAGKEETFTFLEDVLSEVAELFPSPYIHIGGDEADKTRWKECKYCQARIKKEGLKDEDELQSYFIRRIEKFLNSKGKKMIGWDEILEGGLAPEATVMSWRGFEGGMEAAAMGHDVIMCPTSYCYFDYYQADPEFQPKAFGGFVTTRKVYSFRPIADGMSPEEAKHVLGGQGNVWTENIPTTKHAEYMALPRMTALAEVLWTPEKQLNWYDFRDRLQEQFKRFDAMKVNYCPGSYKVEAIPLIDSVSGDYSIRLESEAFASEIKYSTLDNDSVLDYKTYSQVL